MNRRDNALAVLQKEEPERIPLLIDGDVMPIGAFERKLRNMGLGVCLQRNEYWMEEQCVTVEKLCHREYTETRYLTPLGVVSCKVRNLSTRSYEADRLHYTLKTQLESMIKSEADFDIAIYIIENTIVHYDDSPYLWAVREMGEDGIVIGSMIDTPYEAVMKFLGHQGWINEQYHHPNEFQKLLRAYENKTQEICEVVAESASQIVLIGSIRECYEPEQFRRYCLPHLRKYASVMHHKGKIVGVRARSQWLNSVRSLISEADLDFVESFPPPPIGGLSLATAREEWGEETVIWLNFPNRMLETKAEETYRYTSELIRNGSPEKRLILGFTDLSTVDPACRNSLDKTVSSIIDSVNKVPLFSVKDNHQSQKRTRRPNCEP